MPDPTPCPRCGAAGTGNFCSECGASRAALTCAACGHTPEPGARFCNRCGKPLGAAEEPAPARAPGAASMAPASRDGGAARESTLGWWVAGLALVALILFVAYPVLSGADGSGASDRAGPPAATPDMRASPDVLNMDPREAADRLYDRVMRAAAAGDSTEVLMFLPMSIAAYDRARPLDPDGLYHLSVLQRTAGDSETALEVAREALGDAPDHLLALGAAADAAEALGQEEAAREYWSRFLEAYDREMAAGRDEYAGHASGIDAMLVRARSAAGA